MSKVARYSLFSDTLQSLCYVLQCIKILDNKSKNIQMVRQNVGISPNFLNFSGNLYFRQTCELQFIFSVYSIKFPSFYHQIQAIINSQYITTKPPDLMFRFIDDLRLQFLQSWYYFATRNDRFSMMSVDQ